jgi:hypothetical protein
MLKSNFNFSGINRIRTYIFSFSQEPFLLSFIQTLMPLIIDTFLPRLLLINIYTVKRIIPVVMVDSETTTPSSSNLRSTVELHHHNIAHKNGFEP